MRGGPHRAAPEFDFRMFEGFAAPGSTQVPDIFFDKIMVHLSDVELRVLLYFFRRTFGFKKFSDNVSISQMVNGIETREGKRLDYGCGLSKSGVTKGLRGLLKKNLIVATRRTDPKRGNLPTNYALNMSGSTDHAADEFDGQKDQGISAQSATPLSSSGDKGVFPSEHRGSAQRRQALFTLGDTQETVTKKQTDKVVNVVPTNDLGNSVRRRPLTGRRTSAISDRAIKAAYGLTDDRIGRVHWLVQRQVETLGAATRNLGHYVKRAAEAVRDGNDMLLDHLLGEFRQVKREIGIGSPPAYFHAMYTEALEGGRGATGTPAATASEAPEPMLVVRDRMIADAEGRGVPVPSHIRDGDIHAVTQWWADAADESPTVDA